MCTPSAGNLLGITLPTLGRMEWTWQTFHFHAGSSGKTQLQSNPGVATRTMRNAAGAVLGTWTYTQFPTQAGFTENEVTTTVTDPLGNRIVNYFSTSVDANFTGWSLYDYSLPFTPQHDAQRGRGRSQSVPPDLRGGLVRAAAVGIRPVRARSVQHGPGPTIYNTNRRPMRSRTVYRGRRHLCRCGQLTVRRRGPLSQPGYGRQLPGLERPYSLRQGQSPGKGFMSSTPRPTPTRASASCRRAHPGRWRR